MAIRAQASAASAASADTTSGGDSPPPFDPLQTGFSSLDDAASARTGSRVWQRVAVTAAIAASIGWMTLAPNTASTALSVVFAFVFAAPLVVRLYAIRSAFAVGDPPAGEAALGEMGNPAAFSPYTILVTLYDEANVAPALVAALDALEYPRQHLEVIFVLEADDQATAEALAEAGLPSHMRVITVPDGRPRTKPRALCYGLSFARGDYVVVYDAEDRPEPDQLLLALRAFQTGPPDLGCLQARLNIYNPRDSLITAAFTIEYTSLFDGVLPALASQNAPIPLGGTSNHLKRAALDDTGGWDPWNVTEDADLGFRLARRGWRVQMLASTTWEEAPRTAKTWLAQRTRWQKGWMQTYVVHMRDPIALWAELGPARFMWFQAVLGCSLLAALAHPWFAAWLVIGMWTGDVRLADAASVIAVAGVAASALATVVLSIITVRRRGHLDLQWLTTVTPLMWLPVSLAAYRAALELFTRPFHWAKTPHGPPVEPAGSGGDIIETRKARGREIPVREPNSYADLTRQPTEPSPQPVAP